MPKPIKSRMSECVTLGRKCVAWPGIHLKGKTYCGWCYGNLKYLTEFKHRMLGSCPRCRQSVYWRFGIKEFLGPKEKGRKITFEDE